MSGIVTYVIELAVGLACATAGIGVWRRDHRLAALFLFLAGSAAIVHAIVALVREGR